MVSTAPLGRCMDYVQEDLAQMQKEQGKWSASYRSNIDAFTEAQKRTQQEIEPLNAQLLSLDDQLADIKEKINSKKLSISKNDQKIKQLLRAVVSN